MNIDGLARHAILLGEAGNAFSESETRVDGLYLFLRQRRLPAALIVGITLSDEKDASRCLSFSIWRSNSATEPRILRYGAWLGLGLLLSNSIPSLWKTMFKPRAKYATWYVFGGI